MIYSSRLHDNIDVPIAGGMPLHFRDSPEIERCFRGKILDVTYFHDPDGRLRIEAGNRELKDRTAEYAIRCMKAKGLNIDTMA